MRSRVLLLAALLRAVTGWSDTEDWSYEEWSEGWQHNAGSAQDVFYAEGPGDTDGRTPELPAATRRNTLTAGYTPTGEQTATRSLGTAGGQVATELPPPTEGPTFARQPTQIVSAVGHNVTFQCKVHNIGEKEVIWMRSRDLQILSVGAAVFSGDSRVSAAQHDATRHDATRHDAARRDRTHNLTIALLRPTDAGKYECQINTDPKRSLYFNLTILPEMPQIDMWVTGGGAVREGSSAVLRCAARVRDVSRGRDAAPARGRDTAPSHDVTPATHAVRLALRWYKDGEPVDLQWEGGISVESYGGTGTDTARGAWRRSVLRVRHVTATRAGRYECRAAPHARAHAHLTLLSEVWAEGMQRDEAAASGAPPPWAARPLAPLAPLVPLAPLAASPRAAALVLAALLVALAGRALLDCTAGLRELQY